MIENVCKDFLQHGTMHWYSMTKLQYIFIYILKKCMHANDTVRRGSGHRAPLPVQVPGSWFRMSPGSYVKINHQHIQHERPAVSPFRAHQAIANYFYTVQLNTNKLLYKFRFVGMKFRLLLVGMKFRLTRMKFRLLVRMKFRLVMVMTSPSRLLILFLTSLRPDNWDEHCKHLRQYPLPHRFNSNSPSSRKEHQAGDPVPRRVSKWHPKVGRTHYINCDCFVISILEFS